MIPLRGNSGSSAEATAGATDTAAAASAAPAAILPNFMIPAPSIIRRTQSYVRAFVQLVTALPPWMRSQTRHAPTHNSFTADQSSSGVAPRITDRCSATVGEPESSQVERVGMSRRIMLPLLAGALAAAVVGCGDTTNGSPSTGSSTPSAQSLFNPCTGIPDHAVEAAGADPKTEEPGIAGVHQSGWEICSWRGAKYTITVFSTSRKVSEFERKPGNVDFQDVTVAGRQGRQFRVEGASKYLDCDVLFPASQGVVQLRILNRAGMDGLEEPCTVLYRVGELIVPALPR
ncbi:DUF3558 domain-containing protein [Nocardia asteroides]